MQAIAWDTLIIQIMLVILLLIGIKTMANTARLTAAVQHLTTVSTSVVALLGSLASQIRDNVGDEDALNSLADTIESQASELASAVTANTPAAGDSAGDAVFSDPGAAGTDNSDAAINDAPVPADDNGGDSNGDNLTVGDVVDANDANDHGQPTQD